MQIVNAMPYCFHIVQDEWIFENADQLRKSFTEYTLHLCRSRQYTNGDFDKKMIAKRAVQELQRLIDGDDAQTIDFVSQCVAPRVTIPNTSDCIKKNRSESAPRES
jgi:hypothetical protein